MIQGFCRHTATLPQDMNAAHRPIEPVVAMVRNHGHALERAVAHAIRLVDIAHGHHIGFKSLVQRQPWLRMLSK
jgi:hypothetical protein